jgi:hypothetical protein
MIHPFYSVSCESPLDTSLSRTSHGSEHTVEPVAESSARRRIQAVHRGSFAPFAAGGVLARPGFASTAIFSACSMDGAVIRVRRVGAPTEEAVTLFITAQLLSFTMSLRVTPSAGSLDYAAGAEGLR